MGNTLPPTNYQWIGDTLSFTLDPTITGLKLKYKKDGEIDYRIIFEDKDAAPTSVLLPSSNGPSGLIWGATSSESHEEWGPPSIAEITDQPTE